MNLKSHSNCYPKKSKQILLFILFRKQKIKIYQFIIEQLWGSVAKHLIDHRNKHHQPLDINKEDIGPLLFRYERFSDETKESIKNKTTKYLTNELNKQKQPNYIFNKMLLSKNNSR